MAAAQHSRGEVGSALRHARREWGWTIDELAIEVQKARQRLRIPAVQTSSIRRQVIAFESGEHQPGSRWRPVLSEALQLPEEQLFGIGVDCDLPRPLLVTSTVTPAVIASMLARRDVHARTEHIFGPVAAQELVDRDLTTIEELIGVIPPHLRREAREAAAFIAELGGWIAQDSGDYLTAERLTARAADNAVTSDAPLRAMILMRRSNIIQRRDPDMALEMACAAASLVENRPASRLHASIARQQALAAVDCRDPSAFLRHADHAADLANAAPGDDNLAGYATPAYVATETAYGLLRLDKTDQAIDALTVHVRTWPDGQQRDHAVAHLRLLRALAQARDYTQALAHTVPAVEAYRAAPSERGRRELRLLRTLLTDRARSNRDLPMTELRKRISTALQGEHP